MGDPLARIAYQILRASRLTWRGDVCGTACSWPPRWRCRSSARHRSPRRCGVGPVGSIFASDEFAPRRWSRSRGAGACCSRCPAHVASVGPAGLADEAVAHPPDGTARLLRGNGARKSQGASAGQAQAAARVRGDLRVRLDRLPVPAHLRGEDPARRVRARRGRRLEPKRPEAEDVPVYGLALADVRRVSVREAGKQPTRAAVSRPFGLEVPRVPQRVRDQIENAGQQRATRDLPRSLKVRAFLAVVNQRLGQRRSKLPPRSGAVASHLRPAAHT